MSAEPLPIERPLPSGANAAAFGSDVIAETLRTAGVTKIDHLWTTHYHGDHVGALLELAKQFPVGHFYDHGKPQPNDRIVSAPFLASYEALSSGTTRPRGV